MHYYSHNIADYRKDTAHLSLLEHGIYRQLLDQYYLSETPICADDAKLMRSLCVRSADEVQALKNVLTDFFVLTENGYIQKRCDIEIEAFHAKSNSAKESAKARWDRVKAEKDANALRRHCEGNANHKPITINQEPLLKEKKASLSKESRAKPFPENFEPDQTCEDLAQELGIRPSVELPKFTDWHTAKGSVFKDWQAAWRTWLRNASKFQKNDQRTTGMTLDEKREQASILLTGRKPKNERILPNETDITPRLG